MQSRLHVRERLKGLWYIAFDTTAMSSYMPGQATRTFAKGKSLRYMFKLIATIYYRSLYSVRSYTFLDYVTMKQDENLFYCPIEDGMSTRADGLSASSNVVEEEVKEVIAYRLDSLAKDGILANTADRDDRL